MAAQQCELCSSKSNLAPYEIGENQALLCGPCLEQIENPEALDINHWRCLHESIWSENPAVKILAWRVLKQLSAETWAQDLLLQLDLEEEPIEPLEEAPTSARDSNGASLTDGDSVTLIKDLDVKGAGFTAKRGTLVKKITLTHDPRLVEGRVNGTLIVLKTEFLKKANR